MSPQPTLFLCCVLFLDVATSRHTHGWRATVVGTDGRADDDSVELLLVVNQKPPLRPDKIKYIARQIVSGTSAGTTNCHTASTRV